MRLGGGFLATAVNTEHLPIIDTANLLMTEMQKNGYVKNNLEKYLQGKIHV